MEQPNFKALETTTIAWQVGNSPKAILQLNFSLSQGLEKDVEYIFYTTVADSAAKK